MRSWGHDSSRTPISIDEVIEAHEHRKPQGVWGTGTAAVISPVGELAYKDARFKIHDGTIGDLTQRLFDAIVQIQYGRRRRRR